MGDLLRASEPSISLQELARERLLSLPNELAQTDVHVTSTDV